MHLFRIGVVASKGCAEGVPSGCYTENNNIFSPSKQRDICVLVYVVAQRFHCLCVWVCHRFYFTDYFSPLPFSPSPLLSLLCCVCLFFYTDWCIFRSVLTRLEPCGFGLGPLLFGSQCGFLPLAHAKQKGGTRKLSFAGGRKSNGTRATLAQPSA